jgi:predicted nucleic acid-binding protein
VYAVHPGEQDKSARANRLLDAIDSAESGVTNSQILLEFYSAATRTRSQGRPFLPAVDARAWVERWLSMLDFRPITPTIAKEACRAASHHQMNIFDAQIWAAAKVHGVPIILTEDLQSSAIIEGVEYINPLAPDFDLAYLGL